MEFLVSLNKAVYMRDCALSGFCLFTDDPAGQELEHCLKTHLKVNGHMSLITQKGFLDLCCSHSKRILGWPKPSQAFFWYNTDYKI